MTPAPQAALLSAQNPLLKRCYTMSESHLSGYRVVIGFERLEDAQDAHEYIAKLQATQEPVQVFPPRIMELLDQVADRNPGTTKGPWEDAQGLPMQDDADAAISWIRVRSVATQEPVQAGELPPLPEPDSFLFQHDETGNTMFVDAQQVEWGFEKNNPRLHKIGGAFTGGQMQAYARAAISARKPLTDEQEARELVAAHQKAVFEFAKAMSDDNHKAVISARLALLHELCPNGIGLEVKP